MPQTKVNRLYHAWRAIHPMWRVFLLALITAVGIFLPSIIMGRGYMLLVGDFNSQQIPFYMHAHDAIRNGQIGWDWLTDLGANFISSYTFYLLGSPFFWMTIPLPSSWVPYCLGPLLILKTSLCALFSFCYLRRHTKNEESAMIGSFLYAFCGFAFYNIFFNHFHDVVVFFPLLLLSIDLLMEEGRRGIAALAIAACAIVNYFFFFGEVVFVLLYYLFRLIDESYPRTIKSFLSLALEAVIGLMIAAFLLLPSILAILQNQRLNNVWSGVNVWVFGKARFLDIVSSYFLPPQFTSQQIYFDGAATRWTSLSAFLPVFGITGVLAFFRSNKKHWLTMLLVTLIGMSLIPVLNSAFVAFNGNLYMRWYYMMVLMMALATAKCLDDLPKEKWIQNAYIVLAITLFLMAIIWLTPNYSDGKLESFGLYVKDNWPYLIGLCAFALLSWVMLRFSLSYLHTKSFFRIAVCFLLTFSFIFGNLYLLWGKSMAYSNQYLIDDAINGADKVSLPDDTVYRIDSDNSLSNIGMFWNVPNVHCFHSIVPASIVDFYAFLGETRSVNSKIDEKQYALRSLTAVRFYCDRKGVSTNFGDPDKEPVITTMPGYHFYAEQAGYHIWENEYVLPIGFAYDEYLLQEQAEKLASSKRASAMIRAVVLSEEQEERLSSYLNHCANLSASDLTQKNYFDDCRARRACAIDSITLKKDGGFVASCSYDEAKLVFFSVPWEEGWSATVNGVPADIERVNVGFMAVVVPAGSSTVEFSYQTPGLTTGLCITGAGCALLAAYWILPKVIHFKKKEIVFYESIHNTED